MKHFFSILLLVAVSFTVKAQDPHFSQYFASPLTLNPAMAGYFKGDYRISGNYRQQWWSVGSPFTTGTVSYDTKLLQNKISQDDVFSVGVLALYDQSLSGGFKSVNASATVAYHKALDEDGTTDLGVGFQFGYASRSINLSKLDFATQFNGSGFDINLPTNETFGVLQKNYLDVNTGLLLTRKTDDNEFYLGASLYHLNQPNTSFQKNEKYYLPVRYTFNSGVRFVLDHGDELFFSGIYMQQAQATDKNIGVAYGYAANEETKIYGGVWYRIQDAISPYIGLNYNTMQMGISYDIVNSSLKQYSNRNGSFELSMNFLLKRPVNYYTNYKGGRIF